MSQEVSKSWIKGEKSPYQMHDITHFPDWKGLIVWDAFFNNLTSGTMLVAGLAWAAGGTLMAAFLPFALTAALCLLVIDLGILVADLGDPKRFVNSLRVMRFTSPLSVGVWGLTCYGIFLGLATICSWILLAIIGAYPVSTYILSAILRLCAVMAIVAAVVVICYKGVVFSCSSQPGVCQARWLPPFMVSDSLLMGMGVFIIITILVAPDSPAPLMLILPSIALLTARCTTFALLWQDLKKRARLVNSRDRNRLIGAIVYGLGGLLPLLLLFCGPFWMGLAAILFLCAGLFERNWIIGLTRPH
ncbi:MAG: polysulfide reductase NrfD [Desulfovibrio sp.]|nr:polysulfide reductase NrfD [Desulfovibrio sp.]